MSRAPASPQRWAPFPVQDWSEYARASHDWRASRRTPRREMAAILALVVVVTVLLALVDLPARTAGGQVVNPYLPPDGATSTVGYSLGGGPSRQLTTTSALFAGPLASQSVANDLGAQLLGVLEGDHARLVWRRVLAFEDHDTEELWSTGADLRLLVTDTPAAMGYLGGVLVLPAAAAPGRTWESAGTVISTDRAFNRAPWRASFTASAADDPDCLVVTGRIEVAGSPGAATTAVRQTWCRGRGPVSNEVTRDGVTERWQVGPAARPSGLVTADPAVPPAARDPRQWQTSSLSAVTVDRAGRETPVAGAPGSRLWVTAAGRAVIGSGDDLVVFDPGPERLVVRHRLHPGGRTIATEVFGDVLVVGTDRRDIVAYDTASGTELWRHRLPDAPYGTLRRLDPTALLTASLSGEVWAIDLADGRIRWRRPALLTVEFPAAAAVGTAVLADPTGDLLAVDAMTGQTRWQESVDGTIEEVRIGFADTTVLAFTDVGLAAHSLADGTAQFTRRAGAWSDLAALPTATVLARTGALVAFGPDGRDLWRQTIDCAMVTVTGDLFACWQQSAVVLLDGQGTEVARTAIVDHFVDQAAVTAAPYGLWWRVSRSSVAPAANWEVYRWQLG